MPSPRVDLVISQPRQTTCLVFCIPIYNDWESAGQLLESIDSSAGQHGWRADVLFVDDGSTDPLPAELVSKVRNLRRIDVLQLRRNVGHQRAIALALTHIQQRGDGLAVVVMDGDGEDRPEDVRWLLREFDRQHQSRIVFAKRQRRTETFIFRVFYQLYKLIHYFLTGIRVEVGNFSVIPCPLLDRLVGIPEVWNHYAAAVHKSRLPVAGVPLARGRRFRGQSKMNFVSLVTHGLSAISVFGETVGVRLLLLTAGLFLFTGATTFAVLLLGLWSAWTIPPWAAISAGFLLVIQLNASLLSVVFTLMILQTRNASSFLPLRDYLWFVQRTIRLHPMSNASTVIAPHVSTSARRSA